MTEPPVLAPVASMSVRAAGIVIELDLDEAGASLKPAPARLRAAETAHINAHRTANDSLMTESGQQRRDGPWQERRLEYHYS